MCFFLLAACISSFKSTQARVQFSHMWPWYNNLLGLFNLVSHRAQSQVSTNEREYSAFDQRSINIPKSMTLNMAHYAPGGGLQDLIKSQNANVVSILAISVNRLQFPIIKNVFSSTL